MATLLASGQAGDVVLYLAVFAVVGVFLIGVIVWGVAHRVRYGVWPESPGERRARR